MHAISSLLSIFSTLILLAQSTTTCAQPLNQLSSILNTSYQQTQSTTLSPRGCSNALSNPSFEASTLSPWTAYYTGSWSSHTPTTGTAHAGTRFFVAQSNSTNASTITLSQSFTLPANTNAGVKCEAWVRANGRASFEVFVGGVSCGSRALVGTGQWVRVGGNGPVRVGSGRGTGQVVVVGVVEGKVRIGIDGVYVGAGC